MSGREYDNRNSGALFPNDRQRQGKRDPQWQGTWTDVNGVEWYLSAWEGEGRRGRYLSVKVGNRKEPKGSDSGYAQPRQDSMDYGRTSQGQHYPPPSNPPPANPPPRRGDQTVTCVDPRDGSHFQATFADAQRNNWEIVQPGGGYHR